MLSASLVENLGLPAQPSGKLRVLHIVENLNDQAVESWLLRVFRESAADYPHIHWTFFCTLPKEGRLDATARALGADIIYSRCEIGDKVNFVRALRDVMKQGNYDILHCHHDVMSALYLTAAAGLPIRKRIVHVHNTSLSLPTPSRIKSQMAREPMRQICLRFADDIVGISMDALHSLVKDAAKNNSHHHVVHYAIDTARFMNASIDPVGIRHCLGFSADARVLLFVGRMVPYKNPLFIVEILDRLADEQVDVVAVFAGAGELEDMVAAMAKQRGLSDRVRVLGFCADVPDLMLNSDMLLWPSIEDPKEGLGLGIIEAQAAGLPILMSLSVPEEAVVIPELVSSLPLESGADAWSKQIVEILNRPRPDRGACRVLIEQSDFSIDAGVRNLMQLYEC